MTGQIRTLPWLSATKKTTWRESTTCLCEARSCSKPASDDQTCFARACSFAKQCPPIYFGSKVKIMWDEQLAVECCARAMVHMKQVAEEATNRLRAELDHSLVMDFACFDLLLWQRAQEMLVGPNPDIEGHSLLTGNLWSRLSSLLRAGNKFDRGRVGEAKEELSSVALMLLREPSSTLQIHDATGSCKF